MNEYFVSINGQTYGPASVEEIRSWYEAGSMSGTDFVWNSEREEWVSASVYPGTADIFREKPSPGLGLESDDELLSHPDRHKTLESEALRCKIHPENEATIVCPQCRQPYCAGCVGTLEGMEMCLDCIGRECEKNAFIAVTPAKRYGYVIAAAVLLFVVVFAGILFAGPTPPPQPEPPRTISIEKSARGPFIPGLEETSDNTQDEEPGEQ